MKVFLAWSGDPSRRAAETFHSWIPNVLQTVQPFMSEEDIAIGSRWGRQLDQELEDSNFGLIFVTPENHDKPWILFEAGALSKSIADSRVTPLLIGITRTELTGPLTHFQSALPNRTDVKRLMTSMNEACGEAALDDERLERVFSTWWKELESNLAELVRDAENSGGIAAQDRRPDSDILAETLEGVRSLQRAFSDPSALLPPEYLDFALSRVRRDSEIHPGVLMDIERGWDLLSDVVENAHMSPDEIWLSALTNAYEDLKKPIEFLIRSDARRRHLRKPSSD